MEDNDYIKEYEKERKEREEERFKKRYGQSYEEEFKERRDWYLFKNKLFKSIGLIRSKESAISFRFNYLCFNLFFDHLWG